MREVFLGFFITYFYSVVALGLVLAVQAAGAWMLLRTRWARPSRRRRAVIQATALVSLCAMIFGFLLRFGRVSRYFPPGFSNWTRNAALIWAVLSGFLVLMLAISRLIPPPRKEIAIGRRRFLLTLRAAAVAAPAVVFGYGTLIERNSVELREESIPIAGLHPDLDGLRLVQLSDIHLSPFLSEKVLARVVAMANETRAHLALVTGDLISFPGDPLDACLDRLAFLRADAGVFGCLGNHEVYCKVENYVTGRAARLGMRFLRSAAEPLRFGAATLNLAGVDYQRMHSKYLIGAEKMIRHDPDGRTLNLLLSHNPDVFPVAARQGWQFTIAGHTHGGQVNVEILRRDLNIARFFTPYTLGQYRLGAAAIYVSRGIGTIGVPIRLGSVPEVALLTLRRA
jgi:predicted MPP superfamily phosphohydrolase